MNKFVSNEFNEKSEAENKIKLHPNCDRYGYLFTPPDDESYFIREQIVQKLLKADIEVERHHCESAFAGQNEISFKYSSLIESADIFMVLKYSEKCCKIFRENCNIHFKTSVR